MLEKYLSVAGICRTEKVIERSRFITTSAHAEGEKEAMDFIAGIRSRYRDATHNCYAFVGDDAGNLLRFSDDSEPQGTAGMPILEVIRSNSLRQCAVVVTRYFGGIKLGAGGLVRAYSGCTAENLLQAKRVLYELCAENRYTLDYSQVKAASLIISSSPCELLDTVYADKVTFLVRLKTKDISAFDATLTDRLAGRLEITHGEPCMGAFPADADK
ncbi:MAG: IMPACT family protein [Clostridia bacterium]|nr:IMPACT family protein [Clostridia bacterium]